MPTMPSSVTSGGRPALRRGIKAVKREWATWLLLVGDVDAELEDYAEVDDWAICTTHWHADPTSHSARVDLRSVEAFQVAEGKLRRTVHGYESRDQALAAILQNKRFTPELLL